MEILIPIIVASSFGLIISLMNNGTFQKFITIGLCFSAFSLAFLDKNVLLLILFMQFILAFISLIYGIVEKELPILERISIITMVSFLMLNRFTEIGLETGINNLIRFALALPILLFIIVIFKRKLIGNKEFGFMIIWGTYATLELFNIVK